MRRREYKTTVYWSEQEKDLLETATLRLGTDISGVIRGSFLEKCERMGLPLPTKDAAAPDNKA